MRLHRIELSRCRDLHLEVTCSGFKDDDEIMSHGVQRARRPVFATILFSLLNMGLLPGQELQPKVLIIGVDGTRLDALAVAQTPNLDALRATGCFSDQAITHLVTHSAACWSSMFTGVWGDKHGVNDPGNSFVGNQFTNYPSFMRRLERVNTNWNTVAYTRWADLKYALDGTDVVTNFGSDAAITTATCNLLTNGNPDVFYTILLDVDSAGHTWGWGPTVSNYVAAIEAADTRVGQIIHALTNRATYAQEDWLVIALADHGEHDKGLWESRATFHIVNGRTAAHGAMWPSPSIVDVCATVLTHMGVPIDPAWNLDARVEGLALPPPRDGTNLIFNGDAEFNSGTNAYAIRDDNQNVDRGIAWWFDPAPITLGRYGTHPNFPTAASPGPTNRGRNFFLGGLGTNNVISQTIDVTGLGADIEDPGMDCLLSGFLGGAGTNAASATFTVRFLNATGAVLGAVSIGPVTAADRGGTTGLLARSTTGRLPIETRLLECVLAMTSPATTNDASADNLSFVLTPAPDVPLVMLAWNFTNQTWQVQFQSRTNRLYALERSTDLSNWAPLGPTNAGTGVFMGLGDPHPPPQQAFYRLNARRLGQ